MPLFGALGSNHFEDHKSHIVEASPPAFVDGLHFRSASLPASRVVLQAGWEGWSDLVRPLPCLPTPCWGCSHPANGEGGKLWRSLRFSSSLWVSPALYEKAPSDPSAYLANISPLCPPFSFPSPLQTLLPPGCNSNLYVNERGKGVDGKSSIFSLAYLVWLFYLASLMPVCFLFMAREMQRHSNKLSPSLLAACTGTSAC